MRWRAVALACALALLAGCEIERQEWRELDTTVYSPATQRLFVGKLSGPRILVMQVDGRTGAQHYLRTLELEADDRVLRLVIDPSGDELRVLTVNAVIAYGVQDLAVRRRVGLEFRAADMALDPAGDTYLVQSGGIRVYRWGRGDPAPEPWVDLPLRYTTAVTPRAAISPDGRYLVSLVGREPHLARIDLLQRTGSIITIDRQLSFQCATLKWRAHGQQHDPATLVAIECRGLGAQSTELSADFASGRAVASE